MFNSYYESNDELWKPRYDNRALNAFASNIIGLFHQQRDQHINGWLHNLIVRHRTQPMMTVFKLNTTLILAKNEHPAINCNQQQIILDSFNNDNLDSFPPPKLGAAIAKLMANNGI